jgi:hypothetical protein
MKTAAFLLATGVLLVSTIEEFVLRQADSQTQTEDRQRLQGAFNTRPVMSDRTGGLLARMWSDSAPARPSPDGGCVVCHDSSGVLTRFVKVEGDIDPNASRRMADRTTAIGSSP